MRIALFLFFISLCSCSWRKEAPLPKVQVCDTSNISYSQTVKPIFETNCYSCHSTAVTQGKGGLDIENYTSLMNYLNRNYDGVFGSQFYRVVSQAPGTLPMPPASKLSDCDISKIKAWIDKGAPNN